MSRIYKIPLILIFLPLFIFGSLTIYVLFKNKRRKYLIQNASVFSKIAIIILGIKPQFKGSFNSSKNYLIVANHLSYLDILILLSKFPAVFVSTKEVEESFPLGFIAKLGGAVFIERRDFSNLKNEISMITNLLKEGFNVVLFPEGTTSDGSQVLDFKAPFLMSAKLANKEILPLCISYKSINRKSVSVKNRDLIFYYGDMQFFLHLWEFLKLKSIDVEITILEPFYTIKLSRKDISSNLKNIIGKHYKPVKDL